MQSDPEKEFCECGLHIHIGINQNTKKGCRSWVVMKICWGTLSKEGSNIPYETTDHRQILLNSRQDVWKDHTIAVQLQN